MSGTKESHLEVLGIDMAIGPSRTVETIIQDGKVIATKVIEIDTSDRPVDIDAPQETVGYTRTCRTCGTAMKVQHWYSSDGGHEDNKYTCPNGHTEWVDGIDS